MQFTEHYIGSEKQNGRRILTVTLTSERTLGLLALVICIRLLSLHCKVSKFQTVREGKRVMQMG
jgi:hypothetical protein